MKVNNKEKLNNLSERKTLAKSYLKSSSNLPGPMKFAKAVLTHLYSKYHQLINKYRFDSEVKRGSKKE